MADLTQAMGLNSPSFYVGFGDKRFVSTRGKALYMEIRAQHELEPLAEPLSKGSFVRYAPTCA
jgi:hypothetical protein